MMKKRYFVIVFLICSFLIGTIVVAKGYIFENQEQPDMVAVQKGSLELKETESGNKVTISLSNKTEKFDKDLERAKANVNFATKNPNTELVKMSLRNVSVSTRNLGDKQIKSLEAYYTISTDKTVRISQSNMNEKPGQLLNECRKINLNGIDAWVYETNGTGRIKQIMFWDGGIYYNIMGRNLSEDELIKIAGSLK